MQPRTIWCSAVSSYLSKGVLALLGCQKEIRLSNVTDMEIGHVKIESDVLAVDLCEVDSQFLAGCRNGSVRLYDIRDLSKIAQGASCKIKFSHGDAVTNVRHIQHHNVLISGLGNKLRLYDLRYCKENPRHGSHLLEYHGYTNEYTIKHPLDVSADGSRIVIANDDNSLQFFDTWTGKRIQHDTLNAPSDTPVTGIKWDRSTQSLLVSGGTAVAYWAWNND